MSFTENLWSSFKNPGRLTRQAIGIFSVNVIGSLTAFLLNIALARSLGTDGYGTYSFVFSQLAFILPLGLLGFPQLLTREVAAATATHDWGLLRGLVTRSRQVVALSVLTASTVWLTTVWVFEVGGPSNLAIYTFAFLTMMFISQDSVTAGQLRGIGDVTLAPIPHSILRPAALAAALVTASLFTARLTPASGMALHALAAALATGIGAIVLSSRRRSKIPNLAPIFSTRRWIKAGLPLMMYDALYAVGTQIPVILLGLFRPVREVGWFRVAVSFGALTPFFLAVLSSVAQPEFARLHASDSHSELQRLTTRVIRLSLGATLPVAMIFIAFGHVLLEGIYGQDYAAAYGPLIVLVVAHVISVGVGPVGILLTMTYHERYALRALGLYALIAALASVILIPWLGAFGASVAYAASIVVLQTAMATYVAKKLRLSIKPWASPAD